MLFYLYYFIWGLNGVFAVFNKKSKIISLISAIFCWIIMWGNTQNPDYNGYLIDYQSQKYSINSEVGFTFLTNIGNNLGLDYNTFLKYVTLICFFLIFKTVSKFTNNYNCFFALYMGFALIYDIVQIRNFIAISIFIYSIPFLLNNKKVMYVFLVLIATTIHFTSSFYLVLVFIKNKTNKKNNTIYKVGALFIVLLCIIIFLNNNKIPFLYDIMKDLIDDKRVDSYMSSSTRLGFLITFGLQAINFLLVYISKKTIYNNYNNIQNERLKIDLRFVDLIYIINIVGFFTYPLCMIDGTFYRLFRNFNILNFILFSATLYSYKMCPKNKVRLSKGIYLIIIVIGMLLWYLREMNNLEFILYPILDNNLLFS